jgi:hypothetical protein
LDAVIAFGRAVLFLLSVFRFWGAAAGAKEKKKEIEFAARKPQAK